MILSNDGIQNAIDAGDLVIDPEPSPRRPTVQRPCPYDTCSNLRLGPQIRIPKKGKPITLDLRKGGVAAFLTELYEAVLIDEGGGYALPRISSSSARHWNVFVSRSGTVGRVMQRESRAAVRSLGSDS